MFKDKIKRVRELLEKEKLDGVLISSVSNISYLTGYSNFSKDEREAYIFLGRDFEYIITDGRYTAAVKREVAHFTLYERGFKNSTEDLLKKYKNKIKTLGIEEDNLTVAEYKAVRKHFKKLKHFELGKLRAVKEKEELEKIKKACELGDKAFKFILGKIKVGVTEKQIAGELEKFIKEQGAEFSFPAIVAFGKNSSVPHHQTGNTELGPESSSGREGRIVLLDFGVKFENYCSDMTRTIFFGKPAEKQKEIYRVVLGAQEKAVDFINKQISRASLRVKSGKKVKASEVDKAARDYIIKKGYPSIPHSLGHGIGLEVHEHPALSPKSKDELREGTVFSIEPGIYIEGFGGVRIEDLFVIENGKLKQITNSPKALIVI